jgi:hypothetical protein
LKSGAQSGAREQPLTGAPMKKKLFTLIFSEENGELDMHADMHAHYAGPDLLRVLVGATQAMGMATGQIIDRLDVNQDEMDRLFNLPAVENCKPRQK